MLIDLTEEEIEDLRKVRGFLENSLKTNPPIRLDVAQASFLMDKISVKILNELDRIYSFNLDDDTELVLLSMIEPPISALSCSGATITWGNFNKTFKKFGKDFFTRVKGGLIKEKSFVFYDNCVKYTICLKNQIKEH